MSAKKKQENELEMPGSNEEGIPCYSKESEALSVEHDKWRRALKNRQGRKVEEWHYWQRVSNCRAL